jgi:hypothetical protein
MCYGSRSPLIFIQGSTTTQLYIQEVLQPETIPFAYGHEGTLFQQDNARPHIARISMQCLVVTQFKVLNLNSRYGHNSAPNVKILAARLGTKGWGWQSWGERG